MLPAVVCLGLPSGRYPANIGAGAALYGGRWHPRGVEVIYAAATLSLAALEVLVHFSVLPRDFVVTEIHIPPAVSVEVVPSEDLPSDWNGFSPSAATQNIGRRWVAELRSAVLCAPSAIVPTERIYILNAKHADFSRIEFLTPAPFGFDPRLK